MGEVEVPDIEEMCTICEPLLLPEGTPNIVTAFPMKVERKKAREELDIVNVIEWRYDKKRMFLLVRRPEGGKFHAPFNPIHHTRYAIHTIIINLRVGLLAGLHEFPTSANVSGASASALIKIPHTLLSELLQAPPSPYTTSSFFTPRSKSSAPSSAGLHISKIKPAGDVIHVFSHIRKTYRVQWVVLEGGGSEPPMLAASVHQAKKLTKAERKAGLKEEFATEEPLPVTAKWISIDEVMDAKYVPFPDAFR